MNRQIRLVGVGVMILFLALIGQLTYLQVIHAGALDANPLNGDQIMKEYNKPRGDIISADGVTLAQSVKLKNNGGFSYRRQYPTGSLFGQITGYYAYIYGADGVEKSYDSILTGSKRSGNFSFSNLSESLKNLLTNSSSTQNVTLTLSDRLQKVAQQGLAGRDGSVVAINPSNGSILAMYSNPSYNPTQLSAPSGATETRAWKQLLHQAGNPLSPGSYRNSWFPGSTFKVVTSAAAYDHDPALTKKEYPVLSYLSLPDTTHLLHNFGGETCGGQIVQLLTVSCDTGFAQLGLDLGGKNLYDEATAFGFDKTPPLDLPNAAKSYFPPVSSFNQNAPELAYSAIGQEDVSATPLEMALVTAGVANGGVIMKPHVLQKVTNNQAKVLSTYKASPWLRATSAATAKSLTSMMESVVNSPGGTGGEVAIPGEQVAAKTGTAQTGTDQTDDWMVAFAPAAHPKIAVAVVLPNQPSADEYQGGTIAAPIAKAVMEAYLNTLTAGSLNSGGTTSSSATNSSTGNSATTSPTTSAATTGPTTSLATTRPTSPTTASSPTTVRSTPTTSRSTAPTTVKSG